MVFSSRFLGSPPHTRGKGYQSFSFWVNSRITPAYAGKSKAEKKAAERRKDHPRIRGEKVLVPLMVTWRKGSPPHTRGKANPFGLIGLVGRITPAYAGKSTNQTGHRMVFKDHPRIRGEKFGEVTRFKYSVGSPPHTRGKVEINKSNSSWLRITPAYAGKSQFLISYH